jgi:hypothetical protein
MCEIRKASSRAISPFRHRISPRRFPNDAEYTGYHRGDWQLWRSPGDVDRAVYLVAGDGVVERWPRAEQLIACA